MRFNHRSWIHWFAVALVLALGLFTFNHARGQSAGAAAAFEGRPSLAGAQGGLGAQSGMAQGGIGVQGNVAGKKLALGNAALMAQLGVSVEALKAGPVRVHSGVGAVAETADPSGAACADRVVHPARAS